MPSINYYVAEAKHLNISVQKVPNTPFHEFRHGKKVVYFNDGFTSGHTGIALISTDNKQITKQLLLNAGLSTSAWREFYSESSSADIRKYAKQLNYPIVIKPQSGTHGRNITIGITTLSHTIRAIKELQDNHHVILAEEMFEGTEIRLLATRKKFLGAIWRRPASVLGNGENTIAQLVKKKNSHTKRTRKQPELYPILIDADAKRILKKQGYTLSSKPKADERVYLRAVSNLAAGGDSIDVTDIIHSSVKQIAVKAIQAIPGLPFGGLDFMTKEYTIKQTPNNYTILEVNSNPMVGMHIKPFEGKSRNVANGILLELFPNAR